MCVRSTMALAVTALVFGSSAGAEAPAPAELPALPGIEINREGGYIELEAEVVNRDAEWLELLVCSPNTREYESILASPARPSHIHLALLMLDLEPGAPLSWTKVEADVGAGAGTVNEGDDGAGSAVRFVVQPPRGPELEIYCIWEDDQGQRHQVAANRWVKNQLTDEPMDENVWLFTGSVFHRMDDPPEPAMPAGPSHDEWAGERAGEQADAIDPDEPPRPHRPRRVYMADLNGTIVSLINFGDDLITRPTTTTNRNDEQAWATRSQRIPPEGTSVTLRLVPTGARGDGGDPPDRQHVPDVPFVPPQQGEAGD